FVDFGGCNAELGSQFFNGAFAASHQWIKNTALEDGSIAAVQNLFCDYFEPISPIVQFGRVGAAIGKDSSPTAPISETIGRNVPTINFRKARGPFIFKCCNFVGVFVLILIVHDPVLSSLAPLPAGFGKKRETTKLPPTYVAVTDRFPLPGPKYFST